MRRKTVFLCTLLRLWMWLWLSQCECAPSSELFSWEKNTDDLSLNSELSLYSEEDVQSSTPDVEINRRYTQFKEFEHKRCNIIMFGLNATDGKGVAEFQLRREVIKTLRLTNIPFDDSEIQEVRELGRIPEFNSSPVLVRFSSAQLQRAIMYNKEKVHPVKIEYDLTKRTIEKQKRLIPLRNRMLGADIPCFIKLGRLYAKGRQLMSNEVTELAAYYGITLANTVPPPP